MAHSEPPLPLLRTLYDSLLAEPPWLAFLRELEDYLQGHHATMVLRRPRPDDPGVLISTQSNTAALTVLQGGLFRESPILDLPEGEVCILSEMVSRQELTSRYATFYAYLQDYGTTEDIIGVNLREADTGMVFRLRCARLTGQPAFAQPDRDRIIGLLPWLRTAIALHARLARREYQLSISEAAVNQLTIGSLVLDERGQVLITNPVADRALAVGDGFTLRSGKLVPTGDAPGALHQALADLLDGSRTGETESLQVARPGSRYWNVLMRPTPARTGIGEGVSRTVLVLFRDAAGTRELSEELLMELFGFTRAEAALAVRLVQGESLNDAAEALGRSRYTARAQLSAIFAKAGVNRQPQLVSHILKAVNQLWGDTPSPSSEPGH